MKLVAPLLLAASLAAAPPAQLTTPFKVVPEGVKKMIGYNPCSSFLDRRPPVGLKKLPEGLNKGAYLGEFRFGPQGRELAYMFVLDESSGKPPRFRFDANRDGDLTNDPAVELVPKPYKGLSGDRTVDLVEYLGNLRVDLKLLGKTHSVALEIYRFDPRDTEGRGSGQILLYYLDCGLETTISSGGKTFKAILQDRHSQMDFSRISTPIGYDYPLWVDRNGDGKATPEEMFDGRKPFSIDGTTFEVTGWSADGSGMAIVKSSKKVPEPPPSKPPVKTLPVGATIPPIKATAMDGTVIDIPATTKGKLVLLDFWATWCSPCMFEMPNVVKSYTAYHVKGLDVVGISLDAPNFQAKVESVRKAKGMPWPQIYEGKNFDSTLATQFGVQGIPYAVLVDGDTGVILAAGEELREEKLAPAIEKFLAAKAAR